MSTDTFLNFADVDNDIEFKEAPMLSSETVEIEDEEVQEEKPEEPKGNGKEELTEAQKNEFLIIYDSIMFEDKFEKQYKLGSKYTATFSTRSTDCDIKISRQLDSMEFSTMHALQTMSAVLTMSRSLVELNGKDLSDQTAAERYNFIRTKSSHLIEMLSKHMIEFDGLVRNALEYGELNF